LAKHGPELLLPKEDLFQEDLLQNTPLTKPVTPVSPRKPPKNNNAKNQANELQMRRNLDEGTSKGKNNMPAKNLPERPLRPKPVRPVSQTGQTSFAQTDRKNNNRGSTLKFATPDLPIHPTDCNETLGMPGTPRGQPLPQRNCTETLSIMGNHKSLDQTSRTRAPPKTTKSESFPQVWRGKVTKERGTRSSCVTPAPNPAKKCLQNFATKIPRKGSENHQKGKLPAQALRSRRVSSASKLPAPCDPKPVRPILQTGQAGFGQTATPGLRPRLCGSA
jgi:hypothetical protein